MTAYLERMPAGYPGDVTRKGNSVLEPGSIGSEAVKYGSPVKLSAGLVAALAALDIATVLHGFLVRPYPTLGAGDLVPGSAPAGAACDVLRSGYISVALASGTAAKGGQVHVRVQADTGKAVGDIEAEADPAVLSIAGEADEGNTGNATIGTLSVAEGAVAGDYLVDFTAATAFNVYDPNGYLMRAGATGSAFSAGGVTFTITAGATPCVAGDSFTVTVIDSGPGNVPIPATFMGPADADGNVEIAYNI